MLWGAGRRPQGIECGDDVTYFLTDAEQIWHRPKSTIFPVSKECE